MSPLDFPLLADENIHPDVIAFLQQNGNDIQTLIVVAERNGQTVRIRVRQW